MNYGSGIDANDLPSRLAQALRSAGVTVGFGVPGGGPNLDVVGALLDNDIDFVLAHAESSAAIMASTHGLISQSPTPVVVTRGPGATSVVNGTAQATLDRFPLTVIADTVPAHQRARVAHQRLDQRALFAPITRVSATLAGDVTDDTLAALAARPTQWPFGAVHLDYDVAGKTEVSPLAELVSAASPAPDLIQSAADLLRIAERPVLIAGMEAAVTPGIREVLNAYGAPVLTTYQAIGLVDSEGPLNAGLFTNGELERSALEGADLIITVGLDLVEPIPRDWTIEAPVLRLSVEPQLDTYLAATVDIVGDLAENVAQLLDPSSASHTWPADAAIRFREAARAEIRACEDSDGLGPLALVAAASSSLPADVTTTVDAGAHFLAIMPMWPVSEPLRLFISNGLATMAFAVPAAIGAATARPGEPVIALTGDGGMAMTLGELETIARRSLPITIVVFNDAALSLIRIKQTDAHGGDATVAYQPTDFAEIANGSGVPGSVVKSSAELRRILADGWDGPRLLDVRIDPSSYPAIITATRG